MSKKKIRKVTSHNRSRFFDAGDRSTFSCKDTANEPNDTTLVQVCSNG